MLDLASKLSTLFFIVVLIYAVVKNVVIVNDCIGSDRRLSRNIVSFKCEEVVNEN